MTNFANPEMVEKQREKAKAFRRKVYDMRVEGHSWPEVSAAMKRADNTCKKYMEMCYEIDGLPRLEKKTPGEAKRFENVDVEAGAMVMAGATDPFDDKFVELKETCKKSGMKPTLVTALIKRLQTQYSPVLAQAKRYTAGELLNQLDDKISMTLGYLDDFALSGASAKDLSIALNILIDKKQLLEGKPTMILDHTSRLAIQESLPMLIHEAQRRGITLDNPAQGTFAPRLVNP